jgi:hypothetical protein
MTDFGTLLSLLARSLNVGLRQKPTLVHGIERSRQVAGIGGGGPSIHDVSGVSAATSVSRTDFLRTVFRSARTLLLALLGHGLQLRRD